MIRGTRHHHSAVLLVRVPPRHGGPWLSTQYTAITLTRVTAPTILKLPSSTVMLRLCRSPHDRRGTPVRLATKRPG